MGKSQTELARDFKVSLSTVSAWESGRQDARLRLSELAPYLGQPIEFFVGSAVPETMPEAVSFRKRYDASKAVRARATAVIDLAAGVLSPAIRSEFGELPFVSVPNYSDMRDKPDAAADALRKEWSLSDGPLRSVVEQLEARGVRVFWTAIESKSLSAFCRWVEGEPFVVLNTGRTDGCRSRFDACHELAHLVMHRNENFDKEDMKQIEREADTFASAFLLPCDPFLEDAPRVFDRDAFLELKRVWRVSVQAMVRRLYDLKAFTPWQYEQAFRLMSSWGWRRDPEPLAGAMEISKIHWRLCDRLEERDLLPEQFAESINVHWDSVCASMPVLEVRQSSLSFRNLMDESVPLGILSLGEEHVG